MKGSARGDAGDGLGDGLGDARGDLIYAMNAHPLPPLAPALHSPAIGIATATGMPPMASACMHPMVSACMPPMVSGLGLGLGLGLACSFAHCALVVAIRSIIGDVRVRCTIDIIWARIISRGWMVTVHWHEIILAEERVAHVTPRGIPS